MNNPLRKLIAGLLLASPAAYAQIEINENLSVSGFLDMSIVDTDDETTGVDSSSYNLDHTGYRKCGQFPGKPQMIVPNKLECDEKAIGRYLYVYLPKTGYLLICEVEVFGLRKYQGYTTYIAGLEQD